MTSCNLLRAYSTPPHQEWQMDAQGVMRVDGVGKVSLISIVDVTSRLKAESYPSLDTSNPALPDYQLTLRRAFLTYGLPQTLTLDHGTVFYDNKTPSPFPTRLHVWLIALGVQVRFTRHQLSHRSRNYRAHSSDVDGSGAVGTGLSFSLRFMGGTGCTARRAQSAFAQSGSLPPIPAPSLSASHSLGALVSTGVGRRVPVTGKGVHLSGSMQMGSQHPPQWQL